MQGMLEVTYIVICQNDLQKSLSMKEVLNNDKVAKAIKSAFASGVRNVDLFATQECEIYLKTKKEHFSFLVSKNFFADLLELAEEDAQKHKRLKKGCDGVEIVDIQTRED